MYIFLSVQLACVYLRETDFESLTEKHSIIGLYTLALYDKVNLKLQFTKKHFQSEKLNCHLLFNFKAKLNLNFSAAHRYQVEF